MVLFFRYSVIGFLLVTTACSSNPVDPTSKVALDDAVISDQPIEARLQPGISARLNAGLGWAYTSAWIENGKTSVFAAGKKSLEPVREFTVKDGLELGSISKIFTGILLQLAEIEGRLHLNQRLDTLFPKLKGSEMGTVTLYDLGLHQSGLPSLPVGITVSTVNPWKGLNKEALLDALAKFRRPSLPPGKINYDRQYSNWGFITLGMVLELAYHRPYADLVQSRILRPLTMSDTGVDQKTGRRARSRTAAAFSLDSDEVALWSFDSFAAATGGIESNAIDMGKLLAAMAQPPAGKLGRALVNSMESGIGWDSEPGHLLLWKNGATAGHAGVLLYDRSKKRGLYLGGNSGVRTDALGSFVMSLAASDLMMIGLIPGRTVTTEEWNRLKGNYVSLDRDRTPAVPITEIQIYETLGKRVGRVLLKTPQGKIKVGVLLVPTAKEMMWNAVDGLSTSHDQIQITERGIRYIANEKDSVEGVLAIELEKQASRPESYPAIE